MKRRQSSFPILRFAAAASVAASTTVHAGTTASDGGVEAIRTNTEATRASTAKDVAPLPPLAPKNTTSLIPNDSSSPRAPETDEGADDESERADSEDNDSSEAEPEANDLWENETGIVYGGFGWRHDKRGGEGGGASRGGPGGIVVLPPPFLSGGHYPKKSSGAGRPHPFGFLRG